MMIRLMVFGTSGFVLVYIFAFVYIFAGAGFLVGVDYNSFYDFGSGVYPRLIAIPIFVKLRERKKEEEKERKKERKKSSKQSLSLF